MEEFHRNRKLLSLSNFPDILQINSKQKIESCSQGVYSLVKEADINGIIYNECTNQGKGMKVTGFCECIIKGPELDKWVLSEEVSPEQKYQDE